MITKELLTQVLGKKVDVVYTEDSNGKKFTNFVRPRYGDFVDEINIYELAHKCKEWAKHNYEYTIDSGLHDSWIAWFNGLELNFIANTEPEAIINACEYLLDIKNNRFKD